MVNNVSPHIKYIFIDESGDLGKLGSSYFTIVALSTHSPVDFQRIVKRTRQRLFKKKLKELPEVKANNSNERIRKFVLEALNKYIESKIRTKNTTIKVEISHLESHSSAELQVADFVAWAVNRKYVLGDSSYYDCIASKVKNQNNEEMWKK